MLELKDGNYDFRHITLISFITKDQKTFQILFHELKTHYHPVAKKTKQKILLNLLQSTHYQKPLLLKKSKKRLEKDMELLTLREATKNNSYRQLHMDKYKKFGTKLTINDGIILRKYRLLIPLTLRSKIVTLAQQGH